VIYGTAYDESLGDQLRVTVIATGLSSRHAAAKQLTADAGAGRAQPMRALRTGTDNVPVLSRRCFAGRATASRWPTTPG
jgi:cell division protein FtsZ